MSPEDRRTPKNCGSSPNESAVKWIRLAFAALVLTAFEVAYLLSDSLRGETNQTIGVLASGDVGGLRDYILSYGARAPLISAVLMVLQALLAFLTSFLLALANGLAFGAFRGGIFCLSSAALTTAISFGIAHAFGRAPVEVIVGKDSLENADR